MKKLFTLALVVLGLAACQNEPEGLDVNLGEEQLVTVSVALPEGTRVASDTGADLATIAGTSDEYQIRYILEVYHKGVSNAQQIKCLDAQSAAFDVRLAPGRKYTFVVWADIVGNDGVSPYYTVPDHTGGGLANISLKDGVWRSDDNLRDAYTITKELDFDGSAINLTLTRPFAKVRVITTDYDDLAKVGIVPAKATVAYKDVYKAYNAVVGAPTETPETPKADVTLDFDIFDYDDVDGEDTIFADYLFAKNEEAVVEFSLDVMEADGTSIKFNNFNTSIPVKRNTVTTIKGDVLTENGKINVSIDGEFTDPGTEVNVANSAADLQEMINNAPEGEETNITLGGDIDLNDLIGMFSTRAAANNGLTIAKEKAIVLDLNGYTLSYESDVQGGQMILNNGKLEIVNGNVVYTYKGQPDSNYGKGNYTIDNNGELTIDANVSVVADGATGKFPHALYVIQNAGKATINGGKIENNYNIAIRQWVGSDKVAAELTINDGEVEGLRALWIQLPNSKTDYAPKANITINGGTLTGTAIDGTADSGNRLAIYSYSYGNQMKDVNIVINDGTFNGDVALTGGRADNKVDTETLTINGGTFRGVYGDVYSYAENALAAKNITINGGEFSSLEPMYYLDNASEKMALGQDVAIENVEGTYMIFNGKGTLDLNGKTVSGSTIGTGANQNLIDVRGNLTIENGTITTTHTGTNMNWNNSTNIFNVTAGGVLNLKKVRADNLGGSDMAFVAHLNNWGEVTLNVEESYLKSTYIAVRVFNSGPDMNNVTIKDSTLEGGSRAFWVHNYTLADFGGNAEKTAKQQALLNFDIFGNGNTFIASNPNRIIEYGFTDEINLDAEGNIITTVSTEEEFEAAVKAGGNIVLDADIEFTKTIAINNADFTLDGKGHTITMADTATNAVALLDIAGGKATIKNVVFDGIKEGAVVRTVNAEINIDNITAKNCKLTIGQGLLRLLGKSSVTNSTFIDNECLMVISLNFDSTNNDPQVVDNCVFENNTCNKTAVVYYVTGASGTINGNKFIGNTVNCEANGATVYMGFQENCTVTNNLFQNNTVNEAGTSSRVAGGVFFGYDMVFNGNAFIGNDVTGTNVVAKDVCVSTYYTSIDLSGNYWGGNAPVEDVNYYVQHKSDERHVILNDYLTDNPIK